jgi:hypothetical protein
MQKRILCTIACLFSLNVSSDYLYEANQSLYNLQINSSGSTGLGSNDDSVSAAFDLGFTFTFYGNDFTKARMATNGCLHFNLTGSYCGDYTPDPLPQYTNTLFPFWTDLIKDGGSAMKAKAFDDYTIFGWYNMREYNRANSDNSIEVWLYPNNTYEYRYGELDIISHDVLIGEQGSTSQIYTYHFFDECNTGTTNIVGTCVNYDWNSSSNAVNTLLEDGGSLYGDGTDQSLCATVPLTSVNCAGYAAAYLVQQCALNSLYDEDCDGYAAAYLTQQCNVSQLYSQECPNYWSAYDDQQCDDDSQYAPFCAGYTTEASVAYFNEDQFDYDYGFTEDDMWYDEEYDEWLDPNDPCYENNCVDFTDADWYALDVEQFGQEQVDDWFGTEITFNDTGMVEWDSTPIASYDDIDVMMDVWDIEQEQHYQDEILLEEFIFQETLLVEDYSEPETFIEFNSIEELDEWFEEETQERLEEEMANLDEPEEEFIEEIFEEEVVEEIFEEIEARQDTFEEELIAEREEEQAEEILEEVEEEFEIVEKENRKGKNRLMSVALNVVKDGIKTATNSYSNTHAGTSSSNTTTNTSNTASSTTSSSSQSGGGISTTSSPSASDQFASATQQTNQVLSMSDTTSSSTSMNVSIVPLPTFDNSASMVVADVQVQNVQGQIDTASSGVMTVSEADQIADKIIAANIEAQQEVIEQEQEATGEYGDESKLMALMGYVPAFNNYREVTMLDATDWYSSQAIYSSATLNDNTGAFYGLVNENLKGLSQMINDQPNIWR